MISDFTRLRHILDAAERIRRYAADERDEKTLDAVIRQLATDRIWQIADKDVPVLQPQIKAIFHALEGRT